MNIPQVQPRVAGIATAVPPCSIKQELAETIASRWLSECASTPEVSMPKVLQIFRNAGVDTRYSVLPAEEITEGRDFREKNLLYMKYGKALGEKTLKSVFQKTGVKPMEIDLFITVSCTGFMIPSLDAHLMNRFPFRANVRRLPVAELGCAGGVSSIIMASDYIRAYPDSNVLILSLELCTLNVQPADTSTDHVISTALFGDGAAAAIITGKRGDGLHILSTANRFFPRTLDFMGYDVENTGLHIFLSPEIPRFILQNISPQMESILAESGLRVEDIDSWLFHPGSSRILKAFENGLNIDRGKLAESTEVLRNYGNLSSATIFFIIDTYLRDELKQSGSYQVIGAVGPGFGFDTVLTEWR
jgi:alkylresorcinol/alkylpyrone synthase